MEYIFTYINRFTTLKADNDFHCLIRLVYSMSENKKNAHRYFPQAKVI